MDKNKKQETKSQDLKYLKISVKDMQPLRKLVEESGDNISKDTLIFIKNVEDEAYPEEMKLMQDIEEIEELEDIYGYYLEDLTIARNIDWYVIYGEDDETLEIVDIASSPARDIRARDEIHEYLTKVINQKAYNCKKNISLSAKENTSYKMIKRMVANGEYEIIKDNKTMWEDNWKIIMHDLILKPICERELEK